MKTLKEYIIENYEEMIKESFESKSLSEFISLSDKKEYEDYFKYGFRIISNITDTYNFSKEQIAKRMSLANWKEDWFYSKDNKKVFNQEEFCNILRLSDKDLNEAKLKEVAVKNSTCFFLFTENYNSKIKKIIAAMILNPKYGKESIQYLQKMSKVKQEREDNANTFYHPDNSLNGTGDMERANKEIKEYYKKASQEQIELLNKTVKELMKYTNAGKNSKETALKYKQSKNYSDEQAYITYCLLKETPEKLIRHFEWGEVLNDKQKNYLSEVMEKLKVK